MANTAKNAILRAKIEGALVDLLIKTDAQNVYVDSNTTLTKKLADIATSIATKASSDDLSTAIANLRTELMGSGVPEAYDTFKELADYIAEHEDVANALTSAIGDKADQTEVDAIQEVINSLGSLANLSMVTEDELDADLLSKINAAADGNHSHHNMDLLDSYDQTNEDLANAVTLAHDHTNKGELDLIEDGDVAKWNAMEGNATDYADSLNSAMDERMTAAEGKVNTLVGIDTNKSARTIAREELAKQLIPETAAEALNSLEEIAAWIQSHPGDATALNNAIVALQNRLAGIGESTGAVKTYIEAAITALNIGEYAKAADLTALAGRVSTLESKAHEHANKSVIDGITAAKVSSWDSKAKVYGANDTVDVAEGEIYVQLID